MGNRSGTIRLLVGALSVLAVTAAACSSSDDVADPDGSRSGGVFGISSDAAPTLLRSGQTCDDVIAGFRTLAAESMTMDLSGVAIEESLSLDASVDDTATRAPSGPAGGGDSSDTNTQEEGIDEPDIVETDGEHVYTIAGTDASEHLIILDAATAEVVGRIDLGTWGNSMMLSGDRLMVISGSGYGIMPVPRGGPAPFPIDVIEDDAGSSSSGDSPAFAPTDEPAPVDVEPLPIEPPGFHVGTTIQIIDVSDPTSPNIVETNEFEGVHNTTRVVDGVARVVLTSYPDVYPMDIGNADFEEAHEAAIDDAELSDWLPQYRTLTADDDGVVVVADEGDVVECEQVLLPEVNAGTAETSVLRVDFNDGFDPSATTTVVADTGSVYASSQNLYIAATRWVSPAEVDDVDSDDWITAIHSFDLTGDGAAVHAAAGHVPGSLLNQYSMSEYNGDLRVATTEGTSWVADPDSHSGVRVLRPNGDTFEEVGSVTGLGVTETIQSVRFMGDTAYVVTFRQTDPLYVIDLSDPTNPRELSELKIPGFSSYLHPIGDDLLVGVGRDADEGGFDTGFLVSVFDVSDPTAPVQVDTFTDRAMSSTAGHDPKAFLWWPDEGTVVVPYEYYGHVIEDTFDSTGDSTGDPTPSQPTGGLLVLDVGADGISERGRVTTGDADARALWLRGLVVQGSLWGTYAAYGPGGTHGGVAVADFGSLDEATFHPFA